MSTARVNAALRRVLFADTTTDVEATGTTAGTVTTTGVEVAGTTAGIDTTTGATDTMTGVAAAAETTTGVAAAAAVGATTEAVPPRRGSESARLTPKARPPSSLATSLTIWTRSG